MMMRALFAACVSVICGSAAAATLDDVEDDAVRLTVYGHQFLIPRTYWEDPPFLNRMTAADDDEHIHLRLMLTTEGDLISAENADVPFYKLDEGVNLTIITNDGYIRTFEELYAYEDGDCGTRTNGSGPWSPTSRT
jgi:hypothetical protein